MHFSSFFRKWVDTILSRCRCCCMAESDSHYLNFTNYQSRVWTRSQPAVSHRQADNRSLYGSSFVSVVVPSDTIDQWLRACFSSLGPLLVIARSSVSDKGQFGVRWPYVTKQKGLRGISYLWAAIPKNQRICRLESYVNVVSTLQKISI